MAKHKKYLAVRHELLPAPAGGDRARCSILWDLKAVSTGISSAHPDRFGRPLQSQGDQQDQCAGQPLAAHLDALSQRTHRGTGRKNRADHAGNLQQSFFTSSGTEANEAAILIARMATGSYDVVALRHAYSGSSAIAKALTAACALSQERRD